MKTFIAVPCMDQMSSLFAQSLAMLQRRDETLIGFQVGSLVYESRNNLAKKALKAEADYVLWLDSDMTFEPNTLIKMIKRMEENDLDFVTGVYFRRMPPYSTTLFDSLEITEGVGAKWSLIDEMPEGLFEIEGCGFGCVLMKADVIMSVASKFNGRMFDPLEGLGEDLAFCWRARQCGYKLWCDADIMCGHVGNTVITKDYFTAFRKIKE